ncbi:MAG: pseudouridine synthase [Epulopiscium sp.]|nr:pseudouridine synthase [Candidatus Epulonipiscium sp.]
MKKIRIDKALAHMGLGTRKEVKKIIKEKRVVVGGKTITSPSTQIDGQNQKITIDNLELDYKEFYYFIINKPQGVISATEDYHHETVIDLLDLEDKNKKLFPVGRLDIDTEGLLLLTNDGKLAHRLLSPKKDVAKTYYAEIEGRLGIEDIESFKEGIILEDGYKCKPAKLEIIESNDISKAKITISEGKFHQVKRMVEAVDGKVVYLQRIKMGGLGLPKDLELGNYREITDEELDLLINP